MPYYDKDQIACARDMDLLTYLQRYEPDQLIRDAGGSYRTRSHDSLKISNGLWCWWSRGIGGRTALDYLTKVRGLEFTEAVERILSDSHISFPAQLYSQQAQATPKILVLPERNIDNRRVFAYLCSRGIDPEIINHCIKHELLYEDRKHHNAVFVGFDGNQPKCACMRSTLSGSTFLQDAEGSDKRFSFSFTASDRNGALVVTEGAVDLLSYLTLVKRENHYWRAVNGVSLGGIYKPRGDKSTVPPALEQYLKDHQQICSIALCLDNDEAGRNAAKGIIAALPEFEMTYRPPKTGKDYNDMLIATIGVRHRVKTRGGNARE